MKKRHFGTVLKRNLCSEPSGHQMPSKNNLNPFSVFNTGICSAISANESSKGPEEITIKLLKQLSIKSTDNWNEEPTGQLYVDASDGGIGAVLETMNGKVIKSFQSQNKLMLPIYELEWCALWKGLTKLRNSMKKFRMNNLRILSDNMIVVEAFTKGIERIFS
eukprot:GHVP01052217.1.p1 GENE.GHVP01052217.1~~GHVP01052217.1.p1  ORF type:complete len:163 (-),score=18.46 GHVP01052217.1:210-698(-)